MPRARFRLQRARQILRYEGHLALLWRATIRAMAPMARVGVSTIYQASLISGVRPRPAMRVERLAPPAVDELVDLVVRRDARGHRPPVSAVAAARRTVLRRLESGQWCFLARVRGELVHHGWFAFDWIEWPGQEWCARPALPHRRVGLGADEAFHSDAYTVEAWRGHGIYAAALTGMLEELRAVGYRRVYAEVELQNSPSSKTHRRLGWQALGTVLHCVPRGSGRAWRWPIGGRSPFVTLPDGSLRFRAMSEVRVPVVA